MVMLGRKVSGVAKSKLANFLLRDFMLFPPGGCVSSYASESSSHSWSSSRTLSSKSPMSQVEPRPSS